MLRVYSHFYLENLQRNNKYGFGSNVLILSLSLSLFLCGYAIGSNMMIQYATI